MQSHVCLGIDVAKEELVIACPQQSLSVQAIANQPTAIRKFLKCLPTGCSLAVEATGIYHEKVADLAMQMGRMVYVLNPKDTRFTPRRLACEQRRIV
ncbi:MAG TPA: hypothetical protein VGN04_15740 [Herbaspirillum sp.]